MRAQAARPQPRGGPAFEGLSRQRWEKGGGESLPEHADEPTADDARASCLRRMSARDRDRMLALERRGAPAAMIPERPTGIPRRRSGG
jgi:hypothetical protein